MLFVNSDHQDFYERSIASEQAENDLSRRALFYCLGLLEVTRQHINELYNFHGHVLKENGLHARWQTKESRKVCNLAFNLFNGFCGRNGLYAMDYTPWRLFDTPLQPYLWEAIRLRFPQKKEES